MSVIPSSASTMFLAASRRALFRCVCCPLFCQLWDLNINLQPAELKLCRSLFLLVSSHYFLEKIIFFWWLWLIAWKNEWISMQLLLKCRLWFIKNAKTSFVMFSTKLSQLLWNLTPVIWNKFVTRCHKIFSFTWIISLHYLVFLQFCCQNERLWNQSNQNERLQNWSNAIFTFFVFSFTL